MQFPVVIGAFVGGQRPPDLGVSWIAAPHRHDADNRMRSAIDQDCASNDGRIACERALPQMVCQDDDRRSRGEFLATESPTDIRIHSECGE